MEYMNAARTHARVSHVKMTVNVEQSIPNFIAAIVVPNSPVTFANVLKIPAFLIHANMELHATLWRPANICAGVLPAEKAILAK